MRNLFMTATFFMLSACNSSSDAESEISSNDGSTASPYSDVGKQIAWNEVSQSAIRAKLKDPDSAQFKNVKFHAGSGKPMTCGEVNSKNGFGGYGGYERFIAAGDTLAVMESEMADGEMEKTWRLLCK